MDEEKLNGDVTLYPAWKAVMTITVSSVSLSGLSFDDLWFSVKSLTAPAQSSDSQAQGRPATATTG